MPPQPDEERSSTTPERMSALEGAGALMVICGLMLAFGIVATPSAASTFLPIGALGIVGGLLVIWLARRGTRR
jgi:Na+/melibiose symporter-like transporter